MKSPYLSRLAMNAVYPQTNNDWANEVSLIFFAEFCDLEENGWLDPWSRSIDKAKLTAWGRVNAESMKNWEMCETNVHLGQNDEYVIPLCIYRKTI